MVRIVSSARGSGVRFVPSAGTGRRRWLCILDPETDAELARAVVAVVPIVERVMGQEVMANRVAATRTVPPALVLRPWRVERAAFEDRVRALATGAGLLRADVAACYPSIAPPAVEAALVWLGVPCRRARRCAGILEELGHHGVRGLPVGPPAAAVLANAVLTRADRALRDEGVAFARWVDDWCVAVHDEADAAAVLRLLGGALAAAGLRLNDAKTRVLAAGVHGAHLSASVAEYHRAADAHALPSFPRAEPLLPRDRGLGPGR